MNRLPLSLVAHWAGGELHGDDRVRSLYPVQGHVLVRAVVGDDDVTDAQLQRGDGADEVAHHWSSQIGWVPVDAVNGQRVVLPCPRLEFAHFGW